MASSVYKRVLLKVSGEVLAGDKKSGIDLKTVHGLAEDIKEIHQLGVQIGIVLGAGNIFRGLAGTEDGIERVAGDHMGMLATIINALALRDALQKKDVSTRVMSAIRMDEIAEPLIRDRAIRHLEKGRILIMAAGTGSPFFTTDTAAALRAVEIEAELLMKGTKVDGVYDKDPAIYKDAVFFERVTYGQVLAQHLKVMDSTAISLCRDNKLLINVFNIRSPHLIKRIISGEKIGTMVSME